MQSAGLIAQAPSTDSTLDLVSTLASASPAVMLAIFIIALIRRWLVLPRELDAAGKRIMELEKERDEFKAMAFSALNVGERVTSVVESRGR